MISLVRSTVAKSTLQVRLATTGADAHKWEEFLSANPNCTGYHRWNWKRVFENTFGWKTFYLVAEDETGVRGILPLVCQGDFRFRRRLCSLPHVREAGIVAHNTESQQLLLQGAKQIAALIDVGQVELRHRADHELDLPFRTEKAAFVLPLESAHEQLWKSLDGKTRNIVRKSLTYGLTTEFNGADSLNEFYAIFCQNMRVLGAPVYSKEFFREIISAFPESTHICIVRHGNKAVAAAFLNGFRDTIEAMWACSLSEALPLKPNMFLYWNLITFAADRGFRVFDFGRCSVGSGTYRFKAQWTSQQIPLRWYSWTADGSAALEPGRGAATNRAAIWMWQRLPLPVTRAIGPTVMRYITGV